MNILRSVLEPQLHAALYFSIPVGQVEVNDCMPLPESMPRFFFLPGYMPHVCASYKYDPVHTGQNPAISNRHAACSSLHFSVLRCETLDLESLFTNRVQ